MMKIQDIIIFRWTQGYTNNTLFHYVLNANVIPYAYNPFLEQSNYID